jgi:hypothetical protein
VEDLNITTQHVISGIKGANWLTLVGNELWRHLEQMSGKAPAFPPDIELMSTRHGVVIRAGATPTMGDRNRGEWPTFYAEVERQLAPFKITEHSEFPGRFEEEEATRAWLRRLLEPGMW